MTDNLPLVISHLHENACSPFFSGDRTLCYVYPRQELVPAASSTNRFVVIAHSKSQAGRLLLQCGVPRGAVGQILARYPLVLLCKPTRADRFDRNAVALAALAHTHGGAAVPPPPADAAAGKDPWATLRTFEARMKAQQKDGTLEQEKADILDSLQFDFGEVRT